MRLRNGAILLVILTECFLGLTETSLPRTEVSKSPYIERELRSSLNVKCNQPSEETGDFRNCTSAKGFPSHEATCQCTRCANILDLTCDKSDLKWHPTTSYACNESAGCNKSHAVRCNFDTRPPKLTCLDTKHGHENDTKSCVCQESCRNVSLRCDKDGTWHLASRTCNESNGTSNSSAKLQYSIRNDTYSYFCAAGYNLKGNKHRHCHKGKLNGTEPKCVEQGGHHAQTLGEEDPETGTFPLDLVLIGIGCSLAVLALVLGLYFGVQSRRKRQRRQAAAANARNNEACQEAREDYMSMNELYVSFNAEFNNVRNK